MRHHLILSHNMKNTFDLEQSIMKCWAVTDDIELLRTTMCTSPMTEDQVDNFLLGLSVIYNAKFEQLFSEFSEFVK